MISYVSLKHPQELCKQFSQMNIYCCVVFSHLVVKYRERYFKSQLPTLKINTDFMMGSKCASLTALTVELFITSPNAPN